MKRKTLEKNKEAETEYHRQIDSINRELEKHEVDIRDRDKTEKKSQTCYIFSNGLTFRILKLFLSINLVMLVIKSLELEVTLFSDKTGFCS